MTELNGSQPRRADGCKCGSNLVDEGTCVICGHGDATIRGDLMPRPAVPAVPSTTPRRDHRHWTRIMVVAAIRRWHRDTGRPPGMTDWAGPGAWWPSSRTVTRLFRTWNNALYAAGIEPRATEEAA